MNEPANFDTNGLKPWNWPDKDKPYWSLKCLLDNNTWDIPPYKPRTCTRRWYICCNAIGPKMSDGDTYLGRQFLNCFICVIVP